jgi:Enoyl-CoA hydratase/isomerase
MPGAASRAWPITSSRATMSSSSRSRNHRLARSCAVCWWPGSIGRSDEYDRSGNTGPARRFPHRDRRQARACRCDPRSAPAQCHRDAATRQLRVAFEALDADDRVRIVVVRALGEHFSSGGEIGGFLEASPEHVSRLAWNIAARTRCRKPVIAASRGCCFGVGFELALGCDFRVASETCLYALPEQRLGQIPGSGGAARLSPGWPSLSKRSIRECGSSACRPRTSDGAGAWRHRKRPHDLRSRGDKRACRRNPRRALRVNPRLEP